MTQLSPRIEQFGPGDQSWLGSRHGVDNAIPVTIDVTASSSKIVDGYMKSGEALALNSSTNLYQPYDSAGSNGTDTLRGFLIADLNVVTGAGNATAAMGKHLFVRKSKLPTPIGSPAASKIDGLFIFLP